MKFKHFVTEEPLKLRQKMGGINTNDPNAPPLDYECGGIVEWMENVRIKVLQKMNTGKADEEKKNENQSHINSSRCIYELSRLNPI